MKTQVNVKFKINKYLYPAELDYQGDRIYVKFPFNREIIKEIKNMEGCKWHGYDPKPKKIWSIANSGRNQFALQYLQGSDVYARWNGESPLVKTTRSVMDHQREGISHILHRRQCIYAGEMGVGKTLTAIEVMELSGIKDWIYVSNRSGLMAVHLELNKWKCFIKPQLYTYEGMVKFVENYNEGDPLPSGIIFDESSKVKTWTAKRTKAAYMLAEQIRKQHTNPFIVCMSGAPAPKSPLDWWAQCEIVAPGFISEGTPTKFRNRLAVVKEHEVDGITFPKILSWKDNTLPCLSCGKPKNDVDHILNTCMYSPSEDEVSKLYKRLKGLVLVHRKKDCLDLPDKRYEIVRLEPTDQVKRLAQLIKNTSPRAIQALTLLRELSDGFQYEDKGTGQYEVCQVCNGSGKTYIPDEDICPTCYGDGKVEKIERVTTFLDTPKLNQLDIDLEAHDDVGRLVIYGGFTGTVDRIVNRCHENGWCTVRLDGRGYQILTSKKEPLECNGIEWFQSNDDRNIAFVGQSDAAGMGITLTASPTIVFFSNTFKPESRTQAEDRIHRIGMDINRGATIKDYFHLKVDEKIHQIVKNNLRLQSLTLGSIPNE